MRIVLLALLTISFALLSSGRADAVKPLAVSNGQATGDYEHPAARGTPLAGPQAVLGTDEREPVFDTTQYPWRTISYLELYEGGDVSGSCTGTFVGPDVLLTAAHCLWGEDNGFTDDVAVVPGKDGTSEPYGFEFAFDWIVPQAWIDSGGTDTEWDFGIIVMNDDTLGGNVGWLAVANMTTETLSRPDFQPAIVGYPGDIGDGTEMWGDYRDEFATVGDFILDYEIDTAPGQSGSAIFSVNELESFLGYVVGIHTTGGTFANHGTRIEAITLDFIVSLCDEFGCQIEAYTETVGGDTLWADADCDGALSSRDNQAIQRFVLQQNALSQTEPCTDIGSQVSLTLPASEQVTLRWADADCDGTITTRDNQAVLRRVLQQNALSQTEPCPDVGAAIVLAQ